MVPPRSVAESLVEALAELPVTGKRVLIARAAEARDVLPEALVERGAEVEILPLYDTVAEPIAEPIDRADYVTFTSSSTVRFYLESASIPNGARVVSIGPVTSETARSHGLRVDVEAQQHDIDGLIEALLADATR
jgi:uroporphyrinogen III methyltransferase/synthase